MLAAALLISGTLWLALLWPGLPARVLVRLASLASGPKLDLWLLPTVAFLLHGLCSWTGRIGLLNLPDLGLPERNQTTARRASAALRLVSVSVLVVLMVGLITASTSANALAGFLVMLAAVFLILWQTSN